MSRRRLIADDDALARAALRTIFDAHDDLELVAEAEDGLQAVEHAERLHPDVVLLDPHAQPRQAPSRPSDPRLGV